MTQEQFGEILGVTGSAVSQWEHVINPTIPEMKYLYTMALEFNTTIEELVYNATLTAESRLSNVLNTKVLAMLFTYLDKNRSLNYAFKKAPPLMRAYLFATIYGFIEEGLNEGQPDREILGYIEQVLKTNEQKTKKPIAKPRKRAGTH